MKKSPQRNNVKKLVSKIPRVRRDDAITAFRKLGYEVDVPHPRVTILREADFPFRRIALPNTAKISLALLELHLEEVGIDSERFIRLVES